MKKTGNMLGNSTERHRAVGALTTIIQMRPDIFAEIIEYRKKGISTIQYCIETTDNTSEIDKAEIRQLVYMELYGS